MQKDMENIQSKFILQKYYIIKILIFRDGNKLIVTRYLWLSFLSAYYCKIRDHFVVIRVARLEREDSSTRRSVYCQSPFRNAIATIIEK